MQISDRVDFVEVGGHLHAQVRAAPEASAADAQALHSDLDRSAFAAWARLPEALDALAARLGSDAGDFEIVVARREDAAITAEVAPDASCAWLAISAARGGAPARAEDALQVLSAAGVVFGLDVDAVRSACAGGTDARIEAARAQPPTHGEDTRFELLVADTRSRAPKVDERGLIDFHELGDIPIVSAGQVLMRRHPPAPAVDGRTVRGETLPARKGVDEGFDLGLRGCAVDAADANLLLARCNGQPVHSRNGVAVEEVLRLKNVNLATGNVHFDGTVEIAGDISPGMTVQASGDIIIGGLVEGARVEAKGSVKIGGGVIARSHVEAGGSVDARFAENATIRAGTVLAIEQMALHCDLEAQNQVAIGAASGRRGRLVGGTTRAMLRVSVPQLGSAAGGITRVQVGVNPALTQRHTELQQAAAQRKSEEEKLEKLVAHLKQHGDPRGVLPRIEASWKQSLEAWGQVLAEVADIERQLALAEGANIDVRVGVEGEVDLAFGSPVKHLRGTYGVGLFQLVDGQVVFSEPSGLTRPVA